MMNFARIPLIFCLLIFYFSAYGLQNLQDHDRTLDPIEEEILVPPPEETLIEGVKSRRADDFFTNWYEIDNYTRIKQEIADDPFPILYFELDTSRKDVFYLQESHSQLKGNAGSEGFWEKVYGTRVSGDDRGVSQNYHFNEPIDPRQNTVRFAPFLKRGMILPLGFMGSLYYNFSYEASFENEGRILHALNVEPRFAYAPTFHGTIYVSDEEWRLAGLDLTAEIEPHNGLLDELRWEQYYGKQDGNWVPETQQLTFSSERMGFKYSGHVKSHFSHFREIDKEDFEKPEYRVTFNEESDQKPYAYWRELRPFELTQKEASDYEWRDSLYFLMNNDEFVDSSDRSRNQFHYSQALWRGHSRINSRERQEIYIQPLISSITFNPIEGWAFQPAITYRQSFEERPQLNLEGFSRFSHGLQRFYGGLDIEYGGFSATAGRNVADFNGEAAVNPHFNTLYSIIARQNYRKLYDKTYLSGSYHAEDFWGGFSAGLGFSFAKRDTLINTQTPDEDEENFTPNNPWNFMSEDDLGHPPSEERFDLHDKVTLDFSLQWQPFREKALYPDSSEVVISESPAEFELTFEHALTSWVTPVDFSRATLSGHGKFGLGMFGETSWKAKAGRFLRDDFLPFMDRHHFKGNQTLLRQDARDGFQLLDYYRFSTNQDFATGHFEHNFSGFFINRIPLLRKTSLNLVGEANTLYLPSKNEQYLEFGAGIDNILGFLRLDYARGYHEGDFYRDGIRIGIYEPFPGFSLR